MTDFEQRLREAVAESAHAARQPGTGELRRRVRQRRSRASATATALLAVVVGTGIHLGTRGHTAEAAPQHSASSTTAIPSGSAAMLASPDTIKPGGSVLVKGGDCSPGTSVVLSLGPADKPLNLATVTADAHGVFTGTVHIPTDTPTGPNTLWAACKSPNPTGKLLHTATLKITG